MPEAKISDLIIDGMTFAYVRWWKQLAIKDAPAFVSFNCSVQSAAGAIDWSTISRQLARNILNKMKWIYGISFQKSSKLKISIFLRSDISRLVSDLFGRIFPWLHRFKFDLKQWTARYTSSRWNGSLFSPQRISERYITTNRYNREIEEINLLWVSEHLLRWLISISLTFEGKVTKGVLFTSIA